MVERRLRSAELVDGDDAKDLKAEWIRAGPRSGTWRSIDSNSGVHSFVLFISSAIDLEFSMTFCDVSE